MTAAPTCPRNVPFRGARCSTALSIAAATGTLTVVIRSPPAARKPMARAAGDTPPTAEAAPMSSETMTPPKRSCCRSIACITRAENTASWAGSIRV